MSEAVGVFLWVTGPYGTCLYTRFMGCFGTVFGTVFGPIRAGFATLVFSFAFAGPFWFKLKGLFQSLRYQVLRDRSLL